MKYNDFLANKQIITKNSGFDVSRESLNPELYDFQKDMTKWAIKKGKCALFTMTGTGKTAMQAEWAKQINIKTKANILIVAPLAVAKQSIHEAAKFDVTLNYARHQNECQKGITITNYEMLHEFDPSYFGGIVLDESSILKSMTGKRRNEIIQFAKTMSFKLACSATPAPNDYMEIGNHSEFFDVMTHSEMLSMFFVHDGKDTSKWRLKGHAKDKFWGWMASWAVFMVKPSDLGYKDNGFLLPGLQTHEHIVESKPLPGCLFAMGVQTLQDRIRERRSSLKQRVRKCVRIIEDSRKPFLVWCGLNDEGKAIKEQVPGSVEIKGSDNMEHKERAMVEFAKGNIPVLITKPKISGFGMNWQVCADMAFLGLSDSFEALFQATNRCYRHKQTKEVNRHLIISEAEGAVLNNIKRKEADFYELINSMADHTKNIVSKNIKATGRAKNDYNPTTGMELPTWI